MGDETNGQAKDRLERMERLMEVLLNVQDRYGDDIRQLYRAQVLLTEDLRQLNAEVRALTDVQKHTDERMNALIAVVDGIVRREPPAA